MVMMRTAVNGIHQQGEIQSIKINGRVLTRYMDGGGDDQLSELVSETSNHGDVAVAARNGNNGMASRYMRSSGNDGVRLDTSSANDERSEARAVAVSCPDVVLDRRWIFVVIVAVQEELDDFGAICGLR